MNRSGIAAILRSEGLEGYAYFGIPDGGSVDKVCLFERDGVWQTVVTDERAVLQAGTARSYGSETEALTDFVEALRVMKSFKEFRI